MTQTLISIPSNPLTESLFSVPTSDLLSMSQSLMFQIYLIRLLYSCFCSNKASLFPRSIPGFEHSHCLPGIKIGLFLFLVKLSCKISSIEIWALVTGDIC